MEGDRRFTHQSGPLPAHAKVVISGINQEAKMRGTLVSSNPRAIQAKSGGQLAYGAFRNIFDNVDQRFSSFFRYHRWLAYIEVYIELEIIRPTCCFGCRNGRDLLPISKGGSQKKKHKTENSLCI